MKNLNFKKQTGSEIEIINNICGLEFRTVVNKEGFEKFMNNVWTYVMELEP